MGYSIIATPKEIASVALMTTTDPHNVEQHEELYWQAFNWNAMAYRRRYVVRHRSLSQEEFELYVRAEYKKHKRVFRYELKKARILRKIAIYRMPMVWLLRCKCVSRYLYLCDEFKTTPTFLSIIEMELVDYFRNDLCR